MDKEQETGGLDIAPVMLLIKLCTPKHMSHQHMSLFPPCSVSYAPMLFSLCSALACTVLSSLLFSAVPCRLCVHISVGVVQHVISTAAWVGWPYFASAAVPHPAALWLSILDSGCQLWLYIIFSLAVDSDCDVIDSDYQLMQLSDNAAFRWSRQHTHAI